MAREHRGSFTKKHNTGPVICIVLVAGVDSQVEREILEREDLEHLHGLPRALLPVNETSILDHWNQAIIRQREIESIYIVSSGAKFKHFERWASSHGIPVNHVVNNGVCDASLSRGAASDMLLGMKRSLQHQGGSSASANTSFLVLGGDTLFYQGFDLSGPLSFYKTIPATSLCLGYTPRAGEDVSKRGVIKVDRATRLVTMFAEKPSAEDAVAHAAAGALCVPVFYMFRTSIVSHIEKFIEERSSIPLGPSRNKPFSCGTLLEWLHNGMGGDATAAAVAVSTPRSVRRSSTPTALSMYAMRLPGSFGLACGDLSEYESLNERWAKSGGGGSGDGERALRVRKRCYARAGLVGNPSDGFYGKTVSLTLANFWADVTLTQSEKLRLKPHPLYDPLSFGGLADLHGIGKREGYQGGMVLLMATCKKFYEYCMQSGIALHKRNFTLQYDTNIPRQVGMSGSSAIVTAAFKALMEFYSITDSDILPVDQPSFVLAVEADELYINAGLQDRVVQGFGGLIAMDFEKEHMEETGTGRYSRLDASLLPPLWIAYEADASDSGKIHADVKARFFAGEEYVVDGMKEFGRLTDAWMTALNDGDAAAMDAAMGGNFAKRREMYGDAVIGRSNLRMVAIAKGCGCSAKFAGSGGTLVGTATEEQFPLLRESYEVEGFIFARVQPYVPEGAVIGPLTR